MLAVAENVGWAAATSACRPAGPASHAAAQAPPCPGSLSSHQFWLASESSHLAAPFPTPQCPAHLAEVGGAIPIHGGFSRPHKLATTGTGRKRDPLTCPVVRRLRAAASHVTHPLGLLPSAGSRRCRPYTSAVEQQMSCPVHEAAHSIPPRFARSPLTPGRPMGCLASGPPAGWT